MDCYGETVPHVLQTAYFEDWKLLRKRERPVNPT